MKNKKIIISLLIVCLVSLYFVFTPYPIRYLKFYILPKQKCDINNVIYYACEQNNSFECLVEGNCIN
jgi:hypothetical protein